MLATNEHTAQTKPAILFPELTRAHLNNGSDLWSLRTGSPGLTKVIISYVNPELFASQPFTAEMTFQLMKSGTAALDTFHFVSRLEETGVMLSNYVNADCGIVEFVVLDDQLETLFPLISSMLREPSFPEDEFERVRALGLQNWKVSRKQTHAVARDLMMSAVFPGMPYGSLITEESVTGLNPGDVARFHADAVAGSKPSLFIASYNPEVVCKVIENGLAFSEKPSINNGDHIRLSAESNAAAEAFQRIPMEGSVQSSIRIGRRLFNRTHADYVAGKVTATILGGYFSSRLMANLREDKGYTYGVGAGIVSLASDGYLTVSADVGNEHVNDAVGEILKEIDRMRSERVDEEELKIVKQYIEGSTLRELDGVFSQLSLLATLDRQGLDAEWVNGFFRKLNGISSGDVQNFSKQYLQEQDLIKVICGDNNQTSI